MFFAVGMGKTTCQKGANEKGAQEGGGKVKETSKT